jgi:GWxTD domain-containing protein
LGFAATRRAGIRYGPALCLCALATAFHAGAGETPVRLPAEAAGEIPFALDAALRLDPRGQEEVYFCFAVPEEELRCVESDASQSRRVGLELQLDNLDEGGNAVLQRTQLLDVPCGEQATASSEAGAAAHRLLFLSAPWPRGVGADFELRLIDRNAVRSGLVYQIQGSHRRGVVRGRIQRPDLAGGRGLSGLIFLWDVQEQAFREGWRGDFLIGEADSVRAAIDPNPRGAFGLRRGMLRAHAEVYGFADRRVRLRAQIREATSGDLVAEAQESFVVPWERTAVVYRAPVEALSSGSYEVRLTLETDGATYTTAGHAQVLWREGFWDQTQSSLLAEATLLLSEEQLDRLGGMEPGQREALLDSVWGDIDGLLTGELLDGPTHALFNERVTVADARYACRVRGSLSDRGRVYIRYGEPDEVQKQLLPRDQDQIGAYLAREITDDEAAETGGVLPRSPHDNSAYEVWEYVGRGAPLIPDREPSTHGRSLKFIFVDRIGNGEYRLIYSSVYGGIR